MLKLPGIIGSGRDLCSESSGTDIDTDEAVQMGSAAKPWWCENFELLDWLVGENVPLDFNDKLLESWRDRSARKCSLRSGR